MSEKVKQIIRAYMELSESERKEVEQFIQNYIRKGLSEQLSDQRSYSLGPLASGKCPTCGK